MTNASPIPTLLQSGGQREFDFTNADFERVRKMIYEHAGIALSPIKRDMVYSRLARRLRATGANSFSVYLDRLQSRGSAEWEAFVNALTTNLTSFFRESHHFDILKSEIRKRWSRRPLKIWCSASSTGEEPYSIAMAVSEAFESATPPVQIVASDLDTNCLAEAKAAMYPMERAERIDAARLSRFFLKGAGAQTGMVRVRPDLTRLVEFKRINLLEPNWPLQGPFDAIFCRNVMIYFDKPTQYKVLARFKPLLRQDGLMFAGHSESFTHATDLFRSIGRTVYERADAAR
jgi:chemotaxis protein methyltransferase CheR